MSAVVECLRELGVEELGARVEMGLEDGDDPFPVAVAGGEQGGAQFGGMVGVVVDDGDPVPLSLALEAADGTAERAQGRHNLGGRHPQFVEAREAGQRVQDIVQARDRQLYLGHLLSSSPDFEAAPQMPGLDGPSLIVVVVTQAVGDRPPL